MVSLVYIFIGTGNDHIYAEFPQYFVHTLYQSLLLHPHDFPIYIVTETHYHPQITALLKTLECPTRNIHLVATEVLPVRPRVPATQFTNRFFHKAYERFEYLAAFMDHCRLADVFHSEMDVLLYTPLSDLHFLMTKHGIHDRCVFVQDAPSRALASLALIPERALLEEFLDFAKSVRTDAALNEMQLLGAYTDKYSFPNTFTDPLLLRIGYVDGAALGQFMGGIDPRNIRNPQNEPVGWKTVPFLNPTVGFVNETATFRATECQILAQIRYNEPLPYWKQYFLQIDAAKVSGIGSMIATSDNTVRVPVHALHIHSKCMPPFVSALKYGYDDLITGDRIFERCDLVMGTAQSLAFNPQLPMFQSHLVALDTPSAATKFEQYALKQPVRIGLYGHDFAAFCAFAPSITIPFILYVHNSDAEIAHRDVPTALLENPLFVRAHVQNANFFHEKWAFLPIGIANAMWPHGKLQTLYRVMCDTYYRAKPKGLYVNMDPATFPYRARVLSVLADNRVATVRRGRCDYATYLEELAQHRFALCVRGNGIDTHRFWEALYLGVIPVIINNKHTNCAVFVKYLKAMDIPFLEIGHFSAFCLRHDRTYFSEELAFRTMDRSQKYRNALAVQTYFEPRT